MAPSFKANDKRFLDRGSSAVDRAGADLEDSAIKESVGILSADVTNYLSLLSHVSTLFPFCIQSITNFVVLLLLFTDHNHLTCITCGISSPITESNHAIMQYLCHAADSRNALSRCLRRNPAHGRSDAVREEVIPDNHPDPISPCIVSLCMCFMMRNSLTSAEGGNFFV